VKVQLVVGHLSRGPIGKQRVAKELNCGEAEVRGSYATE